MLGRSAARTRARACAALVIALVAQGGLSYAHPEPATAAFPGANGRIVFSSDRIDAGYYDIWTMDSNGTDLQQLTYAPVADLDPTWSPGGAFIAFTRYNSGDLDDGEIWVMKADGSGLKKLTANAADDFSPTFSPDGAQIAFSSNRDGDYEIYVMNVDGSGLTKWTSNDFDDLWPAWSPSLDTLVYVANDPSSFNLWRLNALTGGQEVRLTALSQLDYLVTPAWRPDGGTVIATWVQFNAGGGIVDATIVEFDPSDGEQTASWSHSDLRWNVESAPDSTVTIVFDAVAGAQDLGDVFTQTAEDPIPVNRTNTPGADDINPDWQPIPSFPLVDAKFNGFYGDIEWVFDAGITAGCTAERYCPTDPVTRAQMASFLARAMSLPATTTDYFSDDETSIHEANINKLAAAGITSGCTATTYCPAATVTRGQMAAFLHRGFGP